MSIEYAEPRVNRVLARNTRTPNLYIAPHRVWPLNLPPSGGLSNLCFPLRIPPAFRVAKIRHRKWGKETRHSSGKQRIRTHTTQHEGMIDWVNPSRSKNKRERNPYRACCESVRSFDPFVATRSQSRFGNKLLKNLSVSCPKTGLQF